MPELKLAKLPDRVPVKIMIAINPALAKKLQSYADAYRDAYGQEEKISELIPFMLEQFLESDRAFARSTKINCDDTISPPKSAARRKGDAQSSEGISR